MDIVIIDTGCANIASVKFALQRLGYKPTVTHNHEQILNADRLILPGVGTAEHAMNNIMELHLDSVIKSVTQPLLGICLGMQLLAKNSTEGKETVSCLDIFDIEIKLLDSQKLPLPHMGWNQVSYSLEESAINNERNLLFKGIPPKSYFYFVHSYAILTNPYTIGFANYGSTFSAAISKNNFYGVQFHPERSSKAGSQLLQNFINLQSRR